MKLAPIGVSTYVRLDLLRNTIGALRLNNLAQQSELFVFSDAPQPGDEYEVEKVREYLSTIRGFKCVRIIERTTNGWLKNNVGSIEDLLQEYGRCIFLEEDIVTAPRFLEFINSGLHYFEEARNVFSICGYTPPVNLQSIYNLNSYRCERFSAWGFGIWADRYARIEKARISISDLNMLARRRLRAAGTDLLAMLERMTNGEVEALDVRINFTMAKHRLHVICPTQSLASNRGHDGTGIHCGNTDYFDTELDQRSDVQWDFARVRRHSLVERKLFFYRGRHQMRRKNLLRYYLNRKIDFGT